MDLIVVLCAVSFCAGFVDCVVGGGGLIQIPAMFLLLPAFPPATIFGTNKLAMFAGTSVALWRYARRVSIPWRVMLPCAGVAAIGALIGARAVHLLDPQLLKPIILVLLIAVAAYTFTKKDLGSRPSAASLNISRQLIIAALIGAVLGLYDGFFGPGTGSFLIFSFVSLLGFEFLVASASAKLVNVFTNLTPILYFASQDQVLYHYALPMAACNIAGSIVGASVALRFGNRFVRKLFLAIVAVLILRFAWELYLGVVATL